MDYDFPRQFAARIRSAHASYVGILIADGRSADAARKQADLMTRREFRDRVHRAKDKANPLAKSMQRVCEKHIKGF
jgi:hypothetical protein